MEGQAIINFDIDKARKIILDLKNIGFIIFTFFILGMLIGYTYGKEYEITRCYNTMIYSFQKVKEYNLWYRYDTEEALKKDVEYDILLPMEISEGLSNKSEFKNLENKGNYAKKNILVINETIHIKKEPFSMKEVNNT